jgi:hypothetical protein
MKMMGIVWHRIKFDPTEQDLNLENFKAACFFEAEAKTIGDFLEMAFEATNSIDYHWSENEGVKTDANSSKRSTSVGDIVFVDKRIYRVENCGFKLIKDLRRPA